MSIAHTYSSKLTLAVSISFAVSVEMFHCNFWAGVSWSLGTTTCPSKPSDILKLNKEQKCKQ